MGYPSSSEIRENKHPKSKNTAFLIIVKGKPFLTYNCYYKMLKVKRGELKLQPWEFHFLRKISTGSSGWLLHLPQSGFCWMLWALYIRMLFLLLCLLFLRSLSWRNIFHCLKLSNGNHIWLSKRGFHSWFLLDIFMLDMILCHFSISSNLFFYFDCIIISLTQNPMYVCNRSFSRPFTQAIRKENSVSCKGVLFFPWGSLPNLLFCIENTIGFHISHTPWERPSFQTSHRAPRTIPIHFTHNPK